MLVEYFPRKKSLMYDLTACVSSAAWTWAARWWSCRAVARSCPSWTHRATASANTTPTKTCESDTTAAAASSDLDWLLQTRRDPVSGVVDHSVSHCQNMDEHTQPVFLSLHHCVCRIKAFTMIISYIELVSSQSGWKPDMSWSNLCSPIILYDYIVYWI